MKELNRKMSLRHILTVDGIKRRDWSPYEPIRSEDYLLIKDPIHDSEFYFSIIGVDTTTHHSTNFFKIRYCPYSENNTDTLQTDVEEGDLSKHYDRWVKIIEVYNDILDEHIQDSILEGYEDEYFADFDLADDDADARSYSQQAQNNIDDFLVNVAERLRRYRTEAHPTDEVIKEIDILLADIDKLRQTQARQTKRTVFRQFINIMARFRKAAPTIAREIGKDIVKDLLIEGVKDSTKLLDSLNGLLG